MPAAFYMLNIKTFLTLLIFFVLLQLASGQTQKIPCSAPESKQFDFWVGEWQATWKGGGGTNTVTKILNGCVIHEEFKASGEKPLIGLSNSVYNSNRKLWQQTWVDNNGAYLDFTGNWENDKMILSRSIEREGQAISQRMVWYNITEDSFDWNWEGSKDGGKTWQVNWQIAYKRK